MQIPEIILDVAARSRDMNPSNIISTAKGSTMSVKVCKQPNKKAKLVEKYNKLQRMYVYLLSSYPLLCKVDSGGFSSTTEKVRDYLELVGGKGL